MALTTRDDDRSEHFRLKSKFAQSLATEKAGKMDRRFKEKPSIEHRDLARPTTTATRLR